MNNQCGFYGEVAIPPRRYKVRGQCPKCEAVRTLLSRSYGWYFPQHNEPDNITPLKVGEWKYDEKRRLWERLRPATGGAE